MNNCKQNLFIINEYIHFFYVWMIVVTEVESYQCGRNLINPAILTKWDVIQSGWILWRWNEINIMTVYSLFPFFRMWEGYFEKKEKQTTKHLHIKIAITLSIIKLTLQLKCSLIRCVWHKNNNHKKKRKKQHLLKFAVMWLVNAVKFFWLQCIISQAAEWETKMV